MDLVWYGRAADVRKFFLLPDYVDRRKGVVLPPDSELLQGGGGESDKATAVREAPQPWGREHDCTSILPLMP